MRTATRTDTQLPAPHLRRRNDPRSVPAQVMGSRITTAVSDDLSAA